MSQLTRALIDLCSAHGGRFFLPYQLHYPAATTRAGLSGNPRVLRGQAARRSLGAVREHVVRTVREMRNAVIPSAFPARPATRT
jgi:hypothetical protein